MPTINLWNNFIKRKRSTKQPATTPDTVVTAALKEPTSLKNPTFILAGDYFAANYLQFNGAYYFIDDCVSVHNGLSELHCTKDVLATYKSAIQAASAYVLYYSHNNVEIVDKRLSTKTAITTQVNSETFNNLGTGESYMLTAVGVDRTSVFACDKGDINHLFTSTTLQSIQTTYDNEADNIKNAITAVTAGNVQDMMKELYKISFDWAIGSSAIVNSVAYSSDAQKFAKNCFVLPISKDNIGGNYLPIMLGKYQSDASGNVNFPRIIHDSATVAIPWQATDWRRNAPYHEIYLYIPYVGVIGLSASELIGVSNLTVNVAIDTYSGVATFAVNADSGAVVGQYSTNIASPYAVGSSNINVVAAGASIVAGVAAVASGVGVPAAIMAGLGVVNAIKPFDSSITGNGGSAGYGLGNAVKCITVFHDTTVTPSSVSAVQGTPYNGSMALSGVSGYVQTSNASIDIAGYSGDKDEVDSLLNGGIYIE